MQNFSNFWKIHKNCISVTRSNYCYRLKLYHVPQTEKCWLHHVFRRLLVLFHLHPAYKSNSWINPISYLRLSLYENLAHDGIHAFKIDFEKICFVVINDFCCLPVTKCIALLIEQFLTTYSKHRKTIANYCLQDITALLEFNLPEFSRNFHALW